MFYKGLHWCPQRTCEVTHRLEYEHISDFQKKNTVLNKMFLNKFTNCTVTALTNINLHYSLLWKLDDTP